MCNPFAGLSDIVSEMTLTLRGEKVSDADIFLQRQESKNWFMEDGKVKTGGFNIDEGFGVRVVEKEAAAFAHSDLLTLDEIARSIALLKNGQIERWGSKFKKNSLIDTLVPNYVDNSLEILSFVDVHARRCDPRVKQVLVSLSDERNFKNVIGLKRQVYDSVRLVRLSISVILEAHGKTEVGSSGGGGQYGLDFFSDDLLKLYVDDAIRMATLNLEALPAPAGDFSVVLGAGWPGVMLHEAVGHGLEGDFNRKGSSIFSGKVGERVAAKGVTVVDDGTLLGARGSAQFDDEGVPCQKTVLIEDGVLVGYMQDTLNARLMNVQPTGNGRRQSYAHLPMPRMTNTYMENGDYSEDEIIASLKKGVYATNFGGGQVDITNGKFVFSANQAFWVEKGKIKYPIKGATLIGHGPTALRNIAMIGNNLRMDPGVGTCGKEGQSIPVGVGQPTIRVEGLTIGGTRV